MCGRGNLGHFAQQFDIRRAVIEIEIADDGAERLAAELPVFFLIDFLENRALIPSGALISLERSLDRKSVV